MDKQRVYQIAGLAVLILIVVGVVMLVNSGKVTLTVANLGGGGTDNGSQANQGNTSQQKVTPQGVHDGVTTQVTIPIEKQADVIIEITPIGFSPDGVVVPVVVKAGTSIIWTNRDKAEHWVYNTTYPDRGTCGTKFNSCGGLKSGTNLRVTFDRAGIWDYVDKLNPKFTGRVVVQ